MKYSCNDIAIIIPTKDRPQKICNLLESIALQKTIPRRIIIVASGQNIEDKVLNPREAWSDVHSYDKQAAMLVDLFFDNFKTYGSAVSHLESAGPSQNEELII